MVTARIAFWNYLAHLSFDSLFRPSRIKEEPMKEAKIHISSSLVHCSVPSGVHGAWHPSRLCEMNQWVVYVISHSVPNTWPSTLWRVGYQTTLMVITFKYCLWFFFFLKVTQVALCSEKIESHSCSLNCVNSSRRILTSLHALVRQGGCLLCLTWFSLVASLGWEPWKYMRRKPPTMNSNSKEVLYRFISHRKRNCCLS